MPAAQGMGKVPVAASAMAALPEFPAMKPLEITDRAAIESCTHRLPCSSDHNFTSLWMWNIDGQTHVGRIGKNLIIRLADYGTHEPRLTLIGDDNLACAAEHALSFTDRLDFVPDFVADQLSSERFVLEHDRDQDDYVLSTSLMATLGGKHLQGKRQAANQCARRLGFRLRMVNGIVEPQTALLELFDRWAASRGKTDSETAGERQAVERLVASWHDLGVLTHGLYDGNTLIGANVFELLPDCVIEHYSKADTSYRGVFPLLQRLHAQQLVLLGVDEQNIEQDLGVDGLREAKAQRQPVRFVWKYRVGLRG